MSTARRKVLIVLALLLLTPVVFLVEEHVRGRAQLRRIERELRARGEKLTIAELVPPKPAPEDNGMPALLAARRLDPPYVPAMRLIAPGCAIVSPRVERWFDPGTAQTGTNINTRLDVRAWEVRAVASLDVIRAALEKPAFDADIQWRRGIHMILPHLTEIKASARMLATSVSLSLREGDNTQAAADLQTLTRFSNTLANEPLVISQIVRIACGYITLTRYWEALQTCEWREAELTEIQTAMKLQDYAGGMARSLEMERAMALMTFEQLRTGKFSLEEVLDAYYPPAYLATTSDVPTKADEAMDFMDRHLARVNEVFLEYGWKYVFVPLWHFAWLDQCMAQYLRVDQEFIESARKQAREHKLDMAWSNHFARMVQEASPYDRLRFSLIYMLMPALDKAMIKALKQDTFESMTATTIALHRFELRHGKLPETLAALVPEFLPALPIDSMDGQPLRYRLNADGSFVLYSVGEDQKDDGGDPTPLDSNQTMRDIWSGRDAVWPQPATPEEIEAFEQRQREKSAASP